MADDAQVLGFLPEQFARVNGKLDNVVASVLDLLHRVTSLESQVALLHGDLFDRSICIDRMEATLGRIERRPELVDSPPP
jgi:hypothetical protein